MTSSRSKALGIAATLVLALALAAGLATVSAASGKRQHKPAKHLKVSIGLPNPGDMTVYVQRFQGKAPKLKLSTTGLPASLTVLGASHADQSHRGQSIVEVALFNSAAKTASASRKQALVLGLTVPGAALSLGIVAPNMLSGPAQAGIPGGLQGFCNSGSAANIAHYLRSYLRGSSSLIHLLNALGLFITDTVCGKADPQAPSIFAALGRPPTTGGGTGSGSTGAGGSGGSTGSGGGSTGTGGGGSGGSSQPCATKPTLQAATYDDMTGDPVFHVQVIGTCAGIIGNPLYYIRFTAPAGKVFDAVNSDSNQNLPPSSPYSPGCSLSNPPTGVLTCNVEYNEPDGGICAHLHTTPDLVAGDQLKIELLDMAMNPIAGFTTTQSVPTTMSSACSL